MSELGYSDFFLRNPLKLIMRVNLLFVGYVLCFVMLLKISATTNRMSVPESTGVRMYR